MRSSKVLGMGDFMFHKVLRKLFFFCASVKMVSEATVLLGHEEGN